MLIPAGYLINKAALAGGLRFICERPCQPPNAIAVMSGGLYTLWGLAALQALQGVQSKLQQLAGDAAVGSRAALPAPSEETDAARAFPFVVAHQALVSSC